MCTFELLGNAQHLVTQGNNILCTSGAAHLSGFVPHARGTRGVVDVPGPVSRQVRGCERVQRGGATNATVIAGGTPRPCHRKSMFVCKTARKRRGDKEGKEGWGGGDRVQLKDGRMRHVRKNKTDGRETEEEHKLEAACYEHNTSQ